MTRYCRICDADTERTPRGNCRVCKRRHTRAWQRRNADKKRAYNRTWWANQDPTAKAANRKRNRRRAHDAPLDADTKDYREILRRDPCSYCGAACEHTDHVVSVKRGGAYVWENITAACGGCNASKGAKSLLEFLIWRVTD